MNIAQQLFKAKIYGLDVEILSLAGKNWMTSDDLASVLEYRTNSGIRMAYSRHRKALEAHSIKAKVDGEGWEVRLFDEFGVRYFCEYSKRPGAVHLLRWLDAGGMQIDTAAATAPAPVAANVLAFKSLSTPPPPNQTERRKAYCGELLKTLLGHSTDLEVMDLTHVVEAEVSDLLNRRHCPSLNNARYELYRRFWLKGGDV